MSPLEALVALLFGLAGLVVLIVNLCETRRCTPRRRRRGRRRRP